MEKIKLKVESGLFAYNIIRNNLPKKELEIEKK